jgi:DNA polymerase-1
MDTQESENPQPLLIVDVSGFIFRAYHALPPLSRYDGTPVGALYGFCSMMIKLMKDYPKSPIIAVFDMARKTFRHDIFPNYKSHRPPPPDDLVPQFDLVRQAAESFLFPCIGIDGFEADDIIATIVCRLNPSNQKICIVSSDKDLMQLVSENVFMLDTLKGRTIGAQEVFEKFGVYPDKLRDVLALMGDSSDFVPGVPGIGPKTAAELINQYETLDNLYENLNNMGKSKRKENLENHRNDAFLSRDLVSLHMSAPIIGLDEMLESKRDSIPQRAIDFLDIQGFKALTSRIKAKPNDKNIEQGKDIDFAKNRGTYRSVYDLQELKSIIDSSYKAGVLSVDVETNSLNVMEAKIVGVCLAYEVRKAYYVPIAHKIGNDLFEKPILNQLNIDEVMMLLKPVLCDKSLLKVGHNIKYDMHVLQNYGALIKNFDDTMLMSYVLFGASHGHSMDELAKRYLLYDTIKYEDVAGKGKSEKTFDFVDIDTACQYGAEDADITLQLWLKFTTMLKDSELEGVYRLIDLPMIAVLQKMERDGVYVDPIELRDLSVYLDSKISVLESTIHDLAGIEFNVASSKQVSEILFDRMGLAPSKKGKSGQRSTSIDVLEDLASQGHQIAHALIEWRQMSKLKSTYTDSLLKEISQKTGRVHTSFAMTITNTGRLSSNSPNLQNIPVRTSEGMKIRHAFKGQGGRILLSMDYSQIELRLLAHMASIASLQAAFAKDQDIHALTASEIFDISIEQVSSEHRRKAKAINFGIIYGISAFGLAAQLNISRFEAAEYIKRYNERYPGIIAYMDSSKEYAKINGYVKTMWNRHCYMANINDKNAAIRGFAERQAINAPLQGTAADLIKIAMLRIDQLIKNDPSFSDIKMILQVHDELVFEVPRDISNETILLIKNTMETVEKLSVPLKVDWQLSDNWSYS